MYHCLVLSLAIRDQTTVGAAAICFLSPEMRLAWQPYFNLHRARSTNRGSHMAGPLRSARLPDNLALHAPDEKGQPLFLGRGSRLLRSGKFPSQISEKSVA